MPELPDVELYRVRLAERLVGQRLEKVAVFSPFVVRSFATPAKEFEGLRVEGVERLGKRLVLGFEEDRFIVIHLMIAGRLLWQSPAPPVTKALGKVHLIALRFENGQLTLTESSSKKRAAVYFVTGREGLTEHRRAGVSVFDLSLEAFAQRVKTSRTLKRILTDPATFDGIGNAFSDEILFHARLSPVRLGSALSGEEIERLYVAARETLATWTEKLQREIKGFPKPAQVTAFRPDFAVHGRFDQPCPVCGKPVQHIVYAENETNYCAQCQNEGRLLADRSLSRLLKDDWPKTLEEMLGP